MGITWDQVGPLQWEHLPNKKKGTIAPPCEAKGMDNCVRGRLFVTREKWHQIDGAKWHGVTPVKGVQVFLCLLQWEEFGQVIGR
eukprot:9541583-Prorocentrum_lima.AAC.1